MEIVLLRHGKPDFEFTRPVKARELGTLITSYNSCGIKGEPPVNAVERARQCNAVVCSDLPRSIESANALGIETVHLSDSLFREAELPYSRFGLVPIPPQIWAVVFRMLWFFGFSANGESLATARKRAAVGARKLVEISRAQGSVLFIGHGFINRFIAKELLAHGWAGPTNPGKDFWEYGVYRYNAA